MTQVQGVRRLTYIQAVGEALRQEMERDDTVFIMGEDIAGGAGRPEKLDAWGGPMRLTKGLIEKFGPERVRDTPISEAGFVGAGVGAAATGLRPVVDLELPLEQASEAYRLVSDRKPTGRIVLLPSAGKS